jgi:hypothetical protein
MTDDVKIVSVSPIDGREWLVTADYITEDAKRDPERGGGGMFQAHAQNRSVVAMCIGAQKMDQIVRVSWRDGRAKGYRDLLMVHVL